MSERIGKSFRALVAASIAVRRVSRSPALWSALARSLSSTASLFGGLTYPCCSAGSGARRLRKRDLLRRGYYTGRRVGTYWVYEELREGVVVSLELPLDYLGAASTTFIFPAERTGGHACRPGHASAAPKSSSDCRRCSSAARFISTRTRRSPRRRWLSRVVVLSGSGLSAESGLPTFRDAAGLWRQYSWIELASPEGWRKQPELVLAFYNERRAKAWAAQTQRRASRDRVAGAEVRRGRDHAERGQPA